MTDAPPPIPPPPDEDDTGADERAFRPWKLLLTLGVMLLLVVPMFWVVVVLGDALGTPIGAAVILLATVALVALLFYRADQREVAIGIAAAYVALTVLTGGICTGWQEFVL